MEKFAAISELFEVFLYELVLDKKSKQQEVVTEQIVKSELLNKNLQRKYLQKYLEKSRFDGII